MDIQEELVTWAVEDRRTGWKVEGGQGAWVVDLTAAEANKVLREGSLGL
jgi:hypothetical protein